MTLAYLSRQNSFCEGTYVLGYDRGPNENQQGDSLYDKKLTEKKETAEKQVVYKDQITTKWYLLPYLHL